MGAGPWSELEDQCLRNEHAKQSLDNGASGIRWEVIARSLPGRNNRDVRKRWTNVLKHSYNRGFWTAAEDARLRTAVQHYDTRWVVVAEAVGNRSADQCSKRWHQHLDPALLQTEWNEQEVILLFKAVAFHGTSWSVIQRLHFPRRPSNTIKNQHAIVSRNNERFQRILVKISRVPPCCPRGASPDAGNTIYADPPTPQDNLDAAVHDMSWPSSMSNVESLIAESSNLDSNLSHARGLMPDNFDTSMYCNTTSNAGYASHDTTSNTIQEETFEPKVPTESAEYFPSTLNNSQLSPSLGSLITHEVSVTIRDPDESLITSVIQQLVQARANFSVSQDFG